MKILYITRLTSLFLIALTFLYLTNKTFAQEPSYTYTNQEQDESGLMHYDSRYYDPDLGRFIQPDSLDVPNKYAYVSNDPVNRVDPSGHVDIPTADEIYGWTTIPVDSSPDIDKCCDSNDMFYLDGQWLDMNNAVDFDNYPQDLYGEYYNSIVGGHLSPEYGVIVKAILSELWRSTTLASRAMAGDYLTLEDKIDIAMAPLGAGKWGGKKFFDEARNYLKSFFTNNPKNIVNRVGEFGRPVFATRSITGEVLINEIKYQHVVPHPSQPSNHIENLTASIRKNGFNKEHAVELLDKFGELILIDGHHRTESMKQIGEVSIPARIYITEIFE